MAKNNQKSIRYSDEVAEIIENVEGNGFNEKFENLVLDYSKSIPERVKRVNELDEIISDMEQHLKKLHEDVKAYEVIERKFTRFIREVESLKTIL